MGGKRINGYIKLANLANELEGHTNMIPDHIKSKIQLNKKIHNIIKKMQRVEQQLNQKDWNEGFGWKDEKRSTRSEK